MTDREKWKEEFSHKRYGQSYASLCSDRKRCVDQMWSMTQLEEKEKCGDKNEL